MTTPTLTAALAALAFEEPCMGLGPLKPCPAAAAGDLMLETCSGARLSMCRPCWDSVPSPAGTCLTSGTQEDRDEHFTIVRVLR
jgi:hypothetical protein